MGKEELVDLSKWSDKDLKLYEKAIKKEISKRSDRYKCCIEDGIYDLDLWKKLEDGGLGTSYIGTLRSAFTKALYKICDLTLGNYRLYKSYNDNQKLECSGSKLYDGIYDNYVLMVKEIMDVVRKYDKKVNVIDEQK